MARRDLTAVAAAIAAVAAPAAGQSLAVSPTLIELPVGRHAAVVELTNTAATPVDIQIRPYDWSQHDGHDLLSDDTALRVSPAIATIPAGGTQVVRIVAPAGDHDGSHGGERSWRILVDQLPQPATATGLHIKLRFSIPVFAPGDKAAPPDLRWTATDRQLSVVNAGAHYVRFAAIRVTGPAGTATVDTGETPYLLAGARRQWTLAAPAAGEVDATIGSRTYAAPILHDASP